jgi:hypothetical protein
MARTIAARPLRSLFQKLFLDSSEFSISTSGIHFIQAFITIAKIALSNFNVKTFIPVVW